MSLGDELLKRGRFEELRSSLDEKKLSAVELCEASLKRAKEVSSQSNAFITLTDEAARRAAKKADARIQAGKQGPLTGIPIAVKDLILSKGIRSTAASKMLSDFVSPYNATVLERLFAQDCVMIGKSNLDEFAMGSSNETSFFGSVKNPWDLSKVPGGSSGGSAAAVAAWATPISLGTDTGGSIRQPSALCGITGLKPTYGRVSRFGVVAFASSLDQVGPMCRDAQGCAAVLDCIGGSDPHDATSMEAPQENCLEKLRAFLKKPEIKGKRIGLPKEFFDSSLEPESQEVVQNAIDFYQSEGAEIKEISLPHNRYALSTYYIICPSEASSNLARYDGVHIGKRSKSFGGNLEKLYSLSRSEGFGDEVKLRILLGTFALSSGYFDAFFEKAAKVRRLIKNDFDTAFEEVDLIMGPTSPSTAFKLKEKSNDPLQMYRSDTYTLSCNLAGIAGMSINAGYSKEGLPVGLQLLGPRWSDSTLLSWAAFFQKAKPETLKEAPL